MKVAICISGQPRNYERGYSELKTWFLDKYDCDIYLHTWEDTSSTMSGGHNFSNTKEYEFTKDDYNKITDLYNPVVSHLQNPIPFDTTGVQGHLGYKLHNILSGYYSTYAAYKLLKNSGNQYDLVIRTRFDLEFTDYISPECLFLKDLDLLDPKQINLFQYPLSPEGYPTRTSEVDDLFAISSMEVMDIYSSCFSFMLKYIYMDEEYPKWLETVVSGNPDKLCPESLLKYHLIKNEVDINYIDSLTKHFTANILR
jgi:hypothetical protein